MKKHTYKNGYYLMTFLNASRGSRIYITEFKFNKLGELYIKDLYRYYEDETGETNINWKSLPRYEFTMIEDAEKYYKEWNPKYIENLEEFLFIENL